MAFLYLGIWYVDISTWQDSPLIPGTVDFQKMKDYGARACCLRASNGINEDVDFQTYKRNSISLFPKFSYHYYNNLYPPEEQARKYFDIISPDYIGICVLDLEDTQSGYIGWRHWYNWLVKFQSISGLPDHRIWIYTNEYYFGDYSGYITNEQRAWFSRYPLWLASYQTNPLAGMETYDFNIPLPWTEIVAIQSGTPDIGYEAGVESMEIDYDRFNGNQDRFQYFFGNEIQPPTGTGVTMPYYDIVGTSQTTNRTIRSGPVVTAGAIGSLLAGRHGKGRTDDVKIYTDNFYVNGILRAYAGDRWIHIYENNGVLVDGWIAEIHLGVRYVNATIVGDTPPVTLPATWDVTQVAKDENGNVLATYTGTLTKQ